MLKDCCEIQIIERYEEFFILPKSYGYIYNYTTIPIIQCNEDNPNNGVFDIIKPRKLDKNFRGFEIARHGLFFLYLPHSETIHQKEGKD